MSSHRFIRSNAQPYFSMLAEGVGDVLSLPSFGLAEALLEFRVDSLPVQNATADELHPIFAFDHDLQTQPGILEVGITPSGRFKAKAISGSIWQSGTSKIADATTWNTLDVVYDGGSGQWTVTLNGVADTGTIDGAPQYLVPNAGYNTRLMLFNGRDGLTRAGISLRSAFLAFVGAGGTTTMLYKPTTTQNGSLSPTFGGTLPAAIVSGCVLNAAWYEPLVTHPWGAVPSGGPVGAYAYGMDTDWTRLAKRATQWTRVAA